MSQPRDNLMRVTGMGLIPAEVFVRSCNEAEIVLLDAGKVHEALNDHANRLASKDGGLVIPRTAMAFPDSDGSEIVTYDHDAIKLPATKYQADVGTEWTLQLLGDDPTDIIEPLPAGEPAGPSPAPSVSEADDDDEAIK